MTQQGPEHLTVFSSFHCCAHLIGAVKCMKCTNESFCEPIKFSEPSPLLQEKKIDRVLRALRQYCFTNLQLLVQIQINSVLGAKFVQVHTKTYICDNPNALQRQKFIVTTKFCARAIATNRLYIKLHRAKILYIASEERKQNIQWTDAHVQRNIYKSSFKPTA